ncbi:hypothetical protein [Candidatus Amarobacter glycogenicus]|uniref:hypothetical protein n=1 Tax=Candidatus Amarobacter glycogenicus TaxID=3140699 RepID=UPI002A136658|nr:hypothetical protein [Dehalococcoidia bacterium]
MEFDDLVFLLRRPDFCVPQDPESLVGVSHQRTAWAMVTPTLARGGEGGARLRVPWAPGGGTMGRPPQPPPRPPTPATASASRRLPP